MELNEKIEGLIKKGKDIRTIWINKDEDGTFDVNVWDEEENERDESLGEGRFETMEEAEAAMGRIISNNKIFRFVQLPIEM